MLRYVVLCLLPALLRASSHHYIVLRVLNVTALRETSALFKLVELHNNTQPWACKSGPNPILYNSTLRAHHVTRAKSIDLESRKEVECLGFTVLVVERVRVSAWSGDQTQCQGYFISTNQLEVEDSNKTITFMFVPTLQFDVYKEQPTEDCARHETVVIKTPRVTFTFENDTVSGCYVTSPQSRLLTCNMTISTGDGDTVSMATGATHISIPQFVQRMHMPRIECKCECRIISNNSQSTTRTDTLGYTPRSLENETVTTSPALLSSSGNSEVILVLVYVLAFLFFVSTVMTIVFLHVSRRLHKRLHRVLGEQRKVLSGACGHPASRCRMGQRVNGSATAPAGCFEGHYSTLHRFRNECHHYNTVSLRLSDCIEIGKKAEEKPVYQKLYSNDIEDFSNATSV